MDKRAENNEERLLTTEEISAVLNVSLNTVRKREWRKRNGCPLFRIGKRTYAVEATFWRWVNDRGMQANVENK